jgi:hypothetical protein
MLQCSDRADPHHAAREGGVVSGHHYVQGVAAIGERGGDEAVVGGVADGTRQDPVTHDNSELGFVLVLVAAAYGDLYDGVEQPRGVFSDGQSFEVGFHSLYRPPPYLGLLTLTYGVGLRPSPWAATSETFHT